MKSILKTLRPEPIVNIINGKQTVIVCKKFPKDYVGWVYIYCTKGKTKLTKIPELELANGKVVARFWCDKVEDIRFIAGDMLQYYETDTINGWQMLNKTRLRMQDLANYLGFDKKCGYAVHISKLEVFDKPRELSEFYIRIPIALPIYMKNETMLNGERVYPLTKAPQNYCYIESDK